MTCTYIRMPVHTAKVQRASMEAMCTVVGIVGLQYCLHCDTSRDVDLCCFIDVCGLTIPDFQIMIAEPIVKFGTILWPSYYKYYGYPSSCLYLKHRPVYFSKPFR
jgi:hypothetical protein